MATATESLIAFNRGRVSRLALARTDVARVPLMATVMVNWLPLSLGSMTLRPGLAYITSTRNNAVAKHIPFVFATNDTAIVECSGGMLRVLVGEHPIIRPPVATAIANGTFDAGLDGWVDASEAGGSSSWLSNPPSMQLNGTGSSAGSMRAEIVVPSVSIGVEHALRIVVLRNPVTLRIGTFSGGDDIISAVELGVGEHSLAFIPLSSPFHIKFSNTALVPTYVREVIVEGSTTPMELSSPWGDDDLRNMRWWQSGDVIFVACDGHQQRRIERHATRSWSIVEYRANDGPFRPINTTPTTMTPSAKEGVITLLASKPVFRAGHENSVWKITSVGQQVSVFVTGDNQWTDGIKVTGRGGGRGFEIHIAGVSGTGTVLTLQRSASTPTNWSDVTTYATDSALVYNDDLDDQIIWYRIGADTGGYSGGVGAATLAYGSGGITGTVRVIGVVSPVEAQGYVTKPLGSVSATDTWYEGEWSDLRGWPSSLAVHEGRLWWAGKDKIHGSVSDAFESFDSSTEGDSGPISRSIGSGPVDFINWLVSSQRLLIGSQGAEISVRSTTFDEPLTPTNFNIKESSTRGSANVAAIKIDSRVLFVGRSGERLFEMSYDFASNDYTTKDLSVMNPDLFEGNPVVGVAVQREPDTRVHCVRADGTVAVLIVDPDEELRCWIEVTTDGFVEEAFAMPKDGIDVVYYTVRRTRPNNTAVRNLERWAHERECRPGPIVRLADSHVVYDGAATVTIGGLSHLEGKTVVCWADGRDQGAFVVAGGQITLPAAVSKACVGLGYKAQRESTKLAYAAQGGTALTKTKRVNSLGLLMDRTHARGVRFGPSFDQLESLPRMEDSRRVGSDETWETYDKPMIFFPGPWDTDSRICLEADAPRPVTLLGITFSITTHG